MSGFLIISMFDGEHLDKANQTKPNETKKMNRINCVIKICKRTQNDTQIGWLSSYCMAFCFRSFELEITSKMKWNRKHTLTHTHTWNLKLKFCVFSTGNIEWDREWHSGFCFTSIMCTAFNMLSVVCMLFLFNNHVYLHLSRIKYIYEKRRERNEKQAET